MLRREVVAPRPSARGCIAALIVLAVAAVAALGADRRATDMARRRAEAEAAAVAARAALREVEHRLDQLVVHPIPDPPEHVHPDRRELERARAKLAALREELRQRQGLVTCRMPRLHAAE